MYIVRKQTPCVSAGCFNRNKEMKIENGNECRRGENVERETNTHAYKIICIITNGAVLFR